MLDIIGGTHMLISRNIGVLGSEIPLMSSHLTPDTPWAWNYTTTPQPAFGGRSIAYPRGHILGGSSSVSEFPC